MGRLKMTSSKLQIKVSEKFEEFEWLRFEGDLVPDEFYTKFLDQVRFNMLINEFVLNDILHDMGAGDREKVISLLKRLQGIVTPYEEDGAFYGPGLSGPATLG